MQIYLHQNTFGDEEFGKLFRFSFSRPVCRPPRWLAKARIPVVLLVVGWYSCAWTSLVNQDLNVC